MIDGTKAEKHVPATFLIRKMAPVPYNVMVLCYSYAAHSGFITERNGDVHIIRWFIKRELPISIKKNGAFPYPIRSRIIQPFHDSRLKLKSHKSTKILLYHIKL